MQDKYENLRIDSNTKNNQDSKNITVSSVSKTNENKIFQSIVLDPAEDVLHPPISMINTLSVETTTDACEINTAANEKSCQKKNTTDEFKHMEYTDKTPLQLKSVAIEELYEFDLSDPITEPVTVEGTVDNSYEDDSVIKAFIIDTHIENNIPAEPSDKLEEKENLTANKTPEFKVEDILFTDITQVKNTSSSVIAATPQVESIHVVDIEPECDVEDILLADVTHEMPFHEPYGEESELRIEIGNHLNDIEKSSDNINRIILEESNLKVEVDTSNEHIVLINNSEDYLKYQHNIMDNRCISFFWPTEDSALQGSRVSISTEKDKTFIIDLNKIDTSLLGVLMNTQRPIKVLFNAKPVIIWCAKNGLALNHIFDIKTAVSILTDGKYTDNSTKSLVNRYSDRNLEVDNIDFQDFVFIGKFIVILRKKLVDYFQILNLLDVLNLEQRILFVLASSESNGMPYNNAAPNPLAQSICELVESKYGVTTKKELAKVGGILSFSKAYLNERKDLLEVRECLNAENSEKIRKNFDTKHVSEARILSFLDLGPCAGIITKDYSFDEEGLYSFISPSKDSCLVEGQFKELEVRIVAKLMNNSKLLNSFKTEDGPYAYFAAPLFEKDLKALTLDDKFKTRMMLEIIVRNLGEREMLYYVWNTCQAYIKENEIFSLKEKFRKVHSDLINLIQEAQEHAQRNGYITTSTNRISIVKNENKAFYTKVELYINDIFKRALETFYRDFEDYNTDFSPKIKLCTIYNRIITLECDKNIVNIAIDMLTRNMTKSASKILRGMPILLQVNASEQWES